MKATVYWECEAQDANLAGFRIYASQERSRKGDLIATVGADARDAVVELSEDEWFIRVIAYSKADVEDPWEGSVSNVVQQQAPSFNTQTPSAVSAPAVAAVDLGAVVQVAANPASSMEPAQTLQVIEGPSAPLGKLVAEVELPAAGGAADGQRDTHVIPVDGSSGTTRSIVTRAVTEDGQPGTASAAASVPVPERLNHEGVLLAQVNATAGTQSGFPSTTGRGFSLAAGSGYLLDLLTYGALDSSFGNMIGGGTVLYDENRLAPYAQKLWVRSNELDVGVDTTFVLEVYDEIQRTSLAGYFASIDLASLSDTPMFPAGNEGARDRNVRGPEWLTREMAIDGTPRQPIRMQNTRWEYVVRSTAGVGVPSESDWKPLTPGAYITGRYVYVRFMLGDGLGIHRVKSGNVNVYARVGRLVRRGSGTPEASVTAPPGSRYLDQTAEVPYEKSTGQGSTGWVDLRGPAGKKIRTGTASPEGSVTGDPGDLYLQVDSGTGRIFWKRTGTGNTGWLGVGNMGTEISSVSASFNPDLAKNGILYIVDTTGGSYIASLSGTPTVGYSFGIFKSVAANTVTFTPGGTHLINGAVSSVMSTRWEVRWFTYVAADTWLMTIDAGAPSGGSTASTTEVLTGADPSKAVTPDAAAALWEKGSDVASAATISLGEGGFFHITGTTSISDIDFGTDKAGRRAILYFENTLVIANGGNLVCPENRDLVVHQNDIIVVVSEASDLVRVVSYTPAQPRLFKLLASDDAGGQDVATAQPWFPTNPGVTLKANQTYLFEGLLWLSRSGGTTSHTTSMLFGGTATLTSIAYFAMCKSTDVATLGNVGAAMFNVATASTVKNASTGATEQVVIHVKGSVRINAAGTFEPQFQYSAAPGGAPTIKAGSYFRLEPLGDGSIEASGSWS